MDDQWKQWEMILNILEPQYVKLYRRIPKWHVRIEKHDDEAILSRFFLNFNNNIGAIVFHNEVSFDE